ncbi:tetratricopeptide repeat protein [Actinophytocola sp.]|uniref:AfsR/SARP family transcriptional regulator n=1 Tax=Actinophytocola sp. TaxID=1872138 RepID=UPI003D6B23DC
MKLVETCLGILGSTALRIDGEWTEDWGRPREHALLAALLIRPNEFVPVSHLVPWVWFDDEPMPQSPAAALSTYVTRIRRSLAQVDPNLDIRGGNKAYRIEAAKERIDYHHFRALVAEARALGRSGDAQQAADRCEQARALWRGTPLADVASERAHAWRRSVLHNEWLPANILQVETWLHIGNYDQAIALIDEFQNNYPQEIRLTALLLSALHKLGRGTEASALFVAARRKLLDDDDVDGEQYLRRHHDTLIATSTSASTSARTRAHSMPEAAPRQLPPRQTGFVGRTHQLSELDSDLDSAIAATDSESLSGVVIVDGMPGVGKTALVVHWGHRVAHLFPNGTLYATLDGYSDRDPMDPSIVVDDFLIALDHPPHADTSPRHRQMLLSKLLSGRRTLVVLDNARNSEHIRPLVSLLPDSFIVVTSRQQLTHLKTTTGARRVRVKPLGPHETRTLLIHHLGATALDDEHTHHAIELCQGVPLVIHLLAEHLAHHPPETRATIIDQLDRRQLITDVGETGDGTTTAAALFRQSFLALQPSERRLLRLLPLCPGPDFTTDTACACDGRARQDTARSLTILVGAHLLEPPDAAHRYRLHDLLAEFAADRLATDETEIERRHAEQRILTHYLHTALRAAQLLYPSVAAAPPLTTAVDVEPVRIDTREQAKDWFDHERICLAAAIAMATEHHHHAISWRLADPAATYFDRCGYHHDSRTARQHAVTAARADGHRLAEVSSLVGLGLGYLTEADHHQAHHCLTTALHLLEQESNALGQAVTLQHLARLEALQGHHDEALRIFRHCLDFAQQSNALEVQAWATCHIGQTLCALDQHDTALEHFHRAEWLARQVDDQPARASSLAGLGAVLRNRGDHAGAATYCNQALTIAQAVPDLGVTAEIHLELATIAIADRRTHDAINHAHRAVELCEQTNNIATEAPARNTLATALHTDGQPTQATTQWQHAANLYTRAGNTHLADRARDKARACLHGANKLPTARSTEITPARDRDPVITRHRRGST